MHPGLAHALTGWEQHTAFLICGSEAPLRRRVGASALTHGGVSADPAGGKNADRLDNFGMLSARLPRPTEV